MLALARDRGKLDALRDEAMRPEQLHPLQIDLASISAIRELAAHPIMNAQPIDVLVNNVGALLNRFDSTPEGFETSFATNLLGHFVLTEALRDRQLLAEDGIVINVSSGTCQPVSDTHFKINVDSRAV